MVDTDRASRLYQLRQQQTAWWFDKVADPDA